MAENGWHINRNEIPDQILNIDDEKNKKMTENDILELVKKRQSIN